MNLGSNFNNSLQNIKKFGNNFFDFASEKFNGFSKSVSESFEEFQKIMLKNFEEFQKFDRKKQIIIGLIAVMGFASIVGLIVGGVYLVKKNRAEKAKQEEAARLAQEQEAAQEAARLLKSWLNEFPVDEEEVDRLKAKQEQEAARLKAQEEATEKAQRTQKITKLNNELSEICNSILKSLKTRIENKFINKNSKDNIGIKFASNKLSDFDKNIRDLKIDEKYADIIFYLNSPECLKEKEGKKFKQIEEILELLEETLKNISNIYKSNNTEFKDKNDNEKNQEEKNILISFKTKLDEINAKYNKDEPKTALRFELQNAEVVEFLSKDQAKK